MRAIRKATSLWLNTFLSILTTGFLTSVVLPAIAQVTSDGTTNTIVNLNSNNFTILNGINQGSNLFHSFSNFSVPTGGSATFNLVNTPNITTIFSRVTGGNVSNIDGLIRTVNSSNLVSLFLMNPNGIIFGQNAKLDISGSFVGTTANSIKFADGSEFMATNSSAMPLLTIAVPIGLQFGQNPGTITHQASTTGLILKTGKTIGLLGGEVTIDRGKITAPTGQIEVAGLASNTTVNLAQTASGWQFSYPTYSKFQNVRITNGAQINADGVGGGRIQINGQQVTIDGLSSITANTSGGSNGQGILIQGSDSIAIAGSAPTSSTVTNIAADVRPKATGNGGEIRLITPTLKVQDGARIRTRVFGAGKGGSAIVQADRVELLRDTTDGNNNRFASTLAANTEEGSQGHGGNVEITAKTVLIQDGAELRASARGSGDGGNIIVKASDLLSVTGESSTNDPGYLTGMSTSIRENATGQGGSIFLEAGKIEVLNGPSIRTGTYGQGNAGNIYVKANEVTIAGYANSGIVSRFFASAYVLEENGKPRLDRSTGKGGNITFDVGHLKLLEGGKISSSSEAQGNAGWILINADRVELAGKSRSPVQLNFTYALDAGGKSGLYAFSDNTSTKDLPVSQGLRYGDAGSIRINANSLTVRDEAEIVVSSNNNSNAGNLVVQSDTIRLSEQGKLRAEVASGSQGNINLTSSLLLMRDGSQISSNAGSTASGGNISINSKVIVQTNNSDITANAIKGQGGNINLTTQSLIGGAFRPQLTPQSDITASSEFGINGSVQIMTPNVNPNSGLVELPANVTDPSQQIANGCSASQGSRFVATGRGGVPQNPSQDVTSDRTWSDIRDISAYRQTDNVTAQIPITGQTLIQATSWHRNALGKIELLADKHPAQVQQLLTCAAISKN
ncbi:MAG: S-layer family protein [Nostoc sp. NMS1]|uniref:S-layer family protein n=1 Tax=unclassified Nostoc TaxID=2593658 RepID=UPI0025CCDD84|nr:MULTISPECIES: S-layer family protein [unclassified Nostoc]MBN3911014.1 S-layer family protein [Nostoc sp. NMS1]MBN3990644.1 S-layer family protein [Nostoc sp. NMS2]